MPSKTKVKRDSGTWFSNVLNNTLRIVGLVVLLVVAVIVYRYLFSDIVTGRSHFFVYIALWIFTAYGILPRLYRAVSRFYLPNYFFGRTQASDGLLGDPINIAFNGSRSQLIEAMTAAGWKQAEPLRLKSAIKMAYSAVTATNYPNAPVSALFVFNKKQDLAFERDLNGNPRKRHHIRFWPTPENWWLPGGYKTDWLASATFDRNVGLSLFTGQITHKIDANVDKERDFVISTLKQANVVSDIESIKHFTSSYHSRNGGGDLIHTDGSLPFVTIK